MWLPLAWIFYSLINVNLLPIWFLNFSLSQSVYLHRILLLCYISCIAGGQSEKPLLFIAASYRVCVCVLAYLRTAFSLISFFSCLLFRVFHNVVESLVWLLIFSEKCELAGWLAGWLEHVFFHCAQHF